MRPFRFGLQELGGALGDVGTLFPLMVALVLVNGLDPTVVVLAVGLFYVASGLYYRLPMPVQPLKVASAIAISLGLPAATLGAAGLLLGAILLVLAATNLITALVKLFPRPVVGGIQLGVGLLLVKKGASLMLQPVALAGGAPASWASSALPLGAMLGLAALAAFLLFRRLRLFPAPLAVLGLGVGLGVWLGPEVGWRGVAPGLSQPGLPWPGASHFLAAFTLLVIPQLPLTLGNAVVATTDTARAYFGPGARRVTPRALAAGMGLANVGAGLVGAMPMCHGAGGLTAHYKLGARTGGASLMMGGLLVAAALLAGGGLLPWLTLIPISVLGAMLVVVGVYHALLARDLAPGVPLAVALAVALVALSVDNLAAGFGAGLLLYHGLRLGRSLVRGKGSPAGVKG